MKTELGGVRSSITPGFTAPLLISQSAFSEHTVFNPLICADGSDSEICLRLWSISAQIQTDVFSSFSSCWPTDCVTSVKVGADDPSLICIKSDWLTFDLTLHLRGFSCQVSSLRMSIQRKFPRTRTTTCSAAGRGWRGREVAGRTRRTERQHPRREKVSSCFHLLPSDCANLSNLKPTKAAKGYREEILAFS